MDKTKEKILFIYTHSLDGFSGGSQRTLQALDGLKEYFDIIEYSCFKPTNKIKGFFRNLIFYSGMMTPLDNKKIQTIIKNNEIKYIFFDSSLHGRVAKKIKETFPKSKVIINYHNCERKYYYDMYKNNGFLYYLVYLSAKFNESLSNKYADFNIFISKEDKDQMRNIKDSIIIPVTLKDTFKTIPITKEPYVIFLGSSFYANIEAAKFIIKEIAPNVKIKCIIAGKGMKKTFLKNYENVEIIDYVDSLEELFANASAFISPVFSGSGAKIKIAEALMNGKKVLGTSQSFYGYDMNLMDCIICNTAQDFIKEINQLIPNVRFSEKNRKLFLLQHDYKLNKNYYKEVFDFCNKKLK